MHQRKRQDPLTDPARPSALPSGEESRDDALRGDNAEDALHESGMGEGQFAPSMLDDEPVEVPIFDSLDFEERRVDLPCDDDGQVFLAPQRTSEALAGDGRQVIAPPHNEPDVTEPAVSREPPADHGDIIAFEPLKDDFGTIRDLHPDERGADDAHHADWYDQEDQRDGGHLDQARFEEGHEDAIEPGADSLLDSPVQRNVITDVFVTAKAFPAPDVEEPEADWEPEDDHWVGGRITQNSLAIAGDAKPGAADQAFAEACPGQAPSGISDKALVSAEQPQPSQLPEAYSNADRPAVGGGRLRWMSTGAGWTLRSGRIAALAVTGSIASAFGTASRATLIVATGLGRYLRASCLWTGRALGMLGKRSLDLGKIVGGRTMAAVKASLALGDDVARLLTLGIVAFSMLSTILIGRRLAALGARSLTIGAAALAKSSQALSAFKGWSSVAGKTGSAAAKKEGAAFGSALLAGSTALWTRIVQGGHILGGRCQGAFAVVRDLSTLGCSKLSSMSGAALSRSKIATLQACRSIPSQIGHISASQSQAPADVTSTQPKEKSKAKAIASRLSTATGSWRSALPRLPLAGLAGAAASAAVLIAAWNTAPISTSPSVTLAFPSKPLPLPEKPEQQASQSLGRPAPGKLSTRPKNASAVNVTQAGPQASEGETAFPSKTPLAPEDALAALIAAVSPIDRFLASTPSEQQPSQAPEVKDASISEQVGLEGERRLAAEALLQDIETIAGAGEFTKALRIVGLETLIQPGEPYTLLLPNDEAFSKLEQDELAALLHPSGHDRLRTLLSNHILDEQIVFRDFAGETNSYLSLADYAITIAALDAVTIGNASMIAADLSAPNIVVHVIDNLLLPAETSEIGASSSPTAIDEGSDT